MSANTPNLGLFKYDPSTDGAQTFNIQKALNENWDKLDSSILLALAAAAPYSTSQTYALGAYCTRGGKLYKCTTAITSAETWTAAHWTETTMGAELVAISIALQNKADAGHNHDDRYYTETEVNNLLGGKQDSSTAINTSNIGSQSVNHATYSALSNYDADYGLRLRNQGLVGSDTTPSTNGQIYWTYG